MKRIVLFGPPLAGKVSILLAVADQFGAIVTSFEVENPDIDLSNRALSTKWQAEGESHEVVTMSGAVWHPRAWDSLLKDESILLVLDGQSTRLEANLEFCLQLQLLGKVCKAIQVTKCDLADTFDMERILKLGELFEVPVFLSRIDQSESLVQGVRYLARSSV